jgi:hypothetical protein
MRLRPIEQIPLGLQLARATLMPFLPRQGYQSALTNYAVDRRRGMRISSAPAKSVMSHWSIRGWANVTRCAGPCEGAHLLLQVRCAILDKRLDSLFREWHSLPEPRGSNLTGAVTAPTFDSP